MSENAPSLVLLTRQITHYHHPRFAAASGALPRLDVISVANEGKFAQVLSANPPEGYSVHRLCEGIEQYHTAASDGSLAARVRELLDRLSPDVVAISGWASAESYAALGWARRHKRGVVLMSDSRLDDAPRSGLRDWIKSRVVKTCDSGLVAGRAHKAYLNQLGMSNDKIRLGYDVVDNDFFRLAGLKARESDADTRSRLNLPSSYIFASARFVDKKNLHILVSAYELACSGLRTAPDLLIAGDGINREVLEEHAGKVRHGKVHLPGLFVYEDLPALYALSEGFVHIPTSEQWGLVVNEAAAVGLPIVASQECGAAQELITHDENGWLVTAGDVDSVAMGLRKLMALGGNARLRMGEKSLHIVSDWGPERFADSLAQAATLAQGSRKKTTLLERGIINAMSRRVIETVA